MTLLCPSHILVGADPDRGLPNLRLSLIGAGNISMSGSSTACHTLLRAGPHGQCHEGSRCWHSETFLGLDAGVVVHLIHVVDSEWRGASPARCVVVLKISKAPMSTVLHMSADRPVSLFVTRQKDAHLSGRFASP